MARKKKNAQPTLAELIEANSIPETGFAIKEGYEDVGPEELKIIEEPQDESITN